MGLPDPTPGLVIGFSYLWRSEALQDVIEGRKDRPCVIILSQTTRGDPQLGQRLTASAPVHRHSRQMAFMAKLFLPGPGASRQLKTGRALLYQKKAKSLRATAQTFCGQAG